MYGWASQYRYRLISDIGNQKFGQYRLPDIGKNSVSDSTTLITVLKSLTSWVIQVACCFAFFFLSFLFGWVISSNENNVCTALSDKTQYQLIGRLTTLTQMNGLKQEPLFLPHHWHPLTPFFLLFFLFLFFWLAQFASLPPRDSGG